MGWLYEEQRRDEEKRERKHRDEIATLTEANAKLTAEVERLEGDKKEAIELLEEARGATCGFGWNTLHTKIIEYLSRTGGKDGA
jgi:hypothetical protein